MRFSALGLPNRTFVEPFVLVTEFDRLVEIAKECAVNMLPLEMQRIVDGEMGHQERAAILRSLGDDVQQWRTLALALIEEQQWSRDMRCGAIEALESVSSTTQVLHNPQGDASSIQPLVMLPVRGTGGRWSSHWFSALAASVLLCVGVTGGMLYRESQIQGTRSSGLVSDAQTENNRVAESSLKPALQPWDRPADYSADQAPMKMTLAGLDQSTSGSTEIPLIDADRVDPSLIMARDAYELAQLREQLKRQGYRLEVRPKLYSGRLNDGSQVVVPVHNVALKSVGL